MSLALISVVIGTIIGVLGIIVIICGYDFGMALLILGVCFILLPVAIWIVKIGIATIGVVPTILTFLLGVLFPGLRGL